MSAVDNSILDDLPPIEWECLTDDELTEPERRILGSALMGGITLGGGVGTSVGRGDDESIRFMLSVARLSERELIAVAMRSTGDVVWATAEIDFGSCICCGRILSLDSCIRDVEGETLCESCSLSLASDDD